MKKVSTRSVKVGRCNICDKPCKFTKDHVPPKGSVSPRKVGIKSLAQTIDSPDSKIARLSQDGVSFRSLCSKCNNTMLGGIFDPALNEFSYEIARIIREHNRLILPPTIDIKLKPQKVARSIIGHLLAAEIRENMSLSPTPAPMPDLMRQYFLNTSADFPTDLNLYFWPYRAKRQVILRGTGVASGNYIVIGDFLKYFPVAFWLTHQSPQKIREKMQDREIPIRGNRLDDYRAVVVRTRENDTFRANWPETPDDNEIILINDSTCFIAEPT